MDFSSLLTPLHLSSLAASYLTEDIPAGIDVGGHVVTSRKGSANLYLKEEGVFAGRPFVDAVFAAVGCTVSWSAAAGTGQRSDGGSFTQLPAREGERYEYAGVPIRLATVEGPLDQILRGERTALCILSRCSGVATAARKLSELAHTEPWGGRVAGTRKTTPGFRLVEKYVPQVTRATGARKMGPRRPPPLFPFPEPRDEIDLRRASRRCCYICPPNPPSRHLLLTPPPPPSLTPRRYGLLVGGADTHRLDLSHMVMLKDNHIWAAGSIAGAVAKARSACGFSTKIEVECNGLGEAREAAGAGADVVMLDNLDGGRTREAAKALKEDFPHLIVEVSGGVTMTNIREYVDENVDIISCGALTQGYKCLDFSLKVNR
jgi:nicotinate-nucleotide pyrophosphorylase